METDTGDYLLDEKPILVHTFFLPWNTSGLTGRRSGTQRRIICIDLRETRRIFEFCEPSKCYIKFLIKTESKSRAVPNAFCQLFRPSCSECSDKNAGLGSFWDIRPLLQITPHNWAKGTILWVAQLRPLDPELHYYIQDSTILMEWYDPMDRIILQYWATDKVLQARK